MKKLSHLCVVSIIFLSTLSAQNAQVEITDVVDQINQDSVRSYIEHLQDYGTRFMLAPNRFEIAEWIKGKFESWGFNDVEIDSFWCFTQVVLPYTNTYVDTVTRQYNVVATLPGSENPDEQFIFGGHYDSFSQSSDQFTTAPGADDNASGTAAVLETARAVMASGYQPKSTLKFIAFAAEELLLFGYSGSEHYAAVARQNGTDIGFVIIYDMIGYPNWSSPVEQVTLNHYYDTDPAEANQLIYQYSGLLPSIGDGGSDLQSFHGNNYQGIFLEEYNFNFSHYHSPTDLLIYLDIDYCTKIIKGGCGVLLSLESEITDVKDYSLPQNFTLFQNYPNPFNSITNISYQIPADNEQGGSVVKLKVFDILGNEIITLVDEYKSSGIYTVSFDAGKLPSGVYLYVLNTDKFTTMKKMILLK